MNKEYFIMAAATQQAVAMGLHGGEIVKALIALLKDKHGGTGGGGGRADYAEGKWIEEDAKPR